MPVIFNLDPGSGVPIYAQVIEQVKRAVAVGALVAGEQLPTVKALAVSLTVNPNTVARAYRELERDAVIETSPGRGSFIRADGAVRDVRTTTIEVASRAIDAAIRDARSLGLARDDVRAAADRSIAHWFQEDAE